MVWETLVLIWVVEFAALMVSVVFVLNGAAGRRLRPVEVRTGARGQRRGRGEKSARLFNDLS